MMKKVTYYLLYGIWFAFSLLPFRIHYIFSDLFYLIIYRLLHYRVGVVRGNLESAFPEKDEAELRAIERRFYHRLCDYFVETVKTMTMTEKQIKRHMVFVNADEVNKSVTEGQSCAIYLGHMFNWEWVTTLPLWFVKEAHCGQLYHALENEVFDRLFIKLRQRWGAVCIPLTAILRTTVEYKRKQQISVIGYLADQVPHWNNIHHWCWFLNHDTPVMTGAERIIVKNHQTAVFLEVRQIKRGYYQGTFKPITRTPEKLKEFEITDIYHRMLEENIRVQPELWLWSHNRWKRTHEEFDRRFTIVDGKVIAREGVEE